MIGQQGAYRKNFGAIHGILILAAGLWLVVSFLKRVTRYETLAEAKIYSINHLSPILSRPPENRQIPIFQPPDLSDEVTIFLDFMGAGHDFDEINITLPQSFEMSKEELITSIERQKEKFCFQLSPQPSCGLISSPFGYRISPFTRKRAFHKGIDIASNLGAPIYAVNRGVVIFSGRKGEYGNAIIIHHGFGFSTLYGHNSINIVKSGDKVERGQLIGYVGNTGRSTASHLHYEVRKDGICVNPKNYLLSKAF